MPPEPVRRVHIVGRKNSGKTTLIVELIQEFARRGVRVGTIKHTHHHHELDTPGKDSFRHREAGAVGVGIIAPGMDAVFFPRRPDLEKTRRIDQMTQLLEGCDLVLVEGGQHCQGAKVEVWRPVGEAPLAASDPSILALVTDAEPPIEGMPVWPRQDVAELCQRVLDAVQRNRAEDEPA